MRNRLRVGVIGLGGAGRAHVRRLNRNPNVERVFGFDPKTISGVKNVEIVKSIKELFSQVDAVTICTPDYLHLEHITSSLGAGKHTLVEKPMVANLKEAKMLDKTLKVHKNLVFGVHHQMRCIPAFLKAKELIDTGRLGRLFYIEANYWHDMRMRGTKFDNWRQEKGQSLIFGHGCHPLDLLMFLTNSEPVESSVYISKNGFSEYKSSYTSATIMLQFPNNVTGKVHVNSSCVYPQLNDIVILGDKGTYIDGVLYTDKGFEQVASFFGNSDWFNTEMNITQTRLPRKVLSFLINAYLRTSNRLSTLFMKDADFGFRRYPLTIYNHDYACQSTIDNFIDAINEKREVVANYEAATKVIALCEELELKTNAKK